MRIKVSVDKIRIDFCNIRQSDFMRFLLRATKWGIFNINLPPIGYVFTFSLFAGESYLFIQYMNFKEREFIEGEPHKSLYTLRLETAPINLITHADIIQEIKAMCEGIYFVTFVNRLPFAVDKDGESLIIVDGDNVDQAYNENIEELVSSSYKFTRGEDYRLILPQA